jgi:hypothetical protein
MFKSLTDSWRRLRGSSTQGDEDEETHQGKDPPIVQPTLAQVMATTGRMQHDTDASLHDQSRKEVSKDLPHRSRSAQRQENDRILQASKASDEIGEGLREQKKFSEAKRASLSNEKSETKVRDQPSETELSAIQNIPEHTPAPDSKIENGIKKKRKAEEDTHTIPPNAQSIKSVHKRFRSEEPEDQILKPSGEESTKTVAGNMDAEDQLEETSDDEAPEEVTAAAGQHQVKAATAKVAKAIKMYASIRLVYI